MLNSKNNVNPFDNFKPDIPTGEELRPGTELFDQLEEAGLKELPKLAFVLIAGGLGERLGYTSGIKIDLPVTIIEDNFCYLKYYIDMIKACEDRALLVDSSLKKGEFYIPLAIMVSSDTEAKTIELLEKNNYFGLKKESVTLVK